MRILKPGKTFSLGSKIIALLTAVTMNVTYFFKTWKVLSIEQQYSLLLLCSFIAVLFGPVDFSILIKNIFEAIKNLKSKRFTEND